MSTLAGRSVEADVDKKSVLQLYFNRKYRLVGFSLPPCVTANHSNCVSKLVYFHVGVLVLFKDCQSSSFYHPDVSLSFNFSEKFSFRVGRNNTGQKCHSPLTSPCTT